jgi:ABC-type nitrate/sulfonate/bicarbonate transport system permease component
LGADTRSPARRRLLIGLAGPVALVAAWQLVYMVVNPALLPSPGATMIRLLDLLVSGDIFPDIFATFIRMGIAYALAGAAGIALGLLIGTFRLVYDSFIGVIDFFRSTPVTTLYPVFVLLFGIQHESKIAMTFWACFFVIVLNTAYGALQAGRVRADMARLYGASRTQVFFWVTFFDSLPQTMIGLRVAISYALIVMILTEMFMGSAAGLGQRVTEAYTTFELAELYAIVLITGTIGLFLNRIFVVAEERIIPWVGK